jgi:hypothetical protein
MYDQNGYTKTSNSLWRRVSYNPNIWKTTLIQNPTNHPRVYYKDTTKFFTWNNYNNFRDSTYSESTWYNPNAMELYVKFSNNNKNPNNIPIYIAHHYTPLRISNNILTNNAKIIISNITFKYTIYGVSISDQSNIIIDNCNFYGGHHGIKVDNFDISEHSNLIFKNNYFNGKQNSDWYSQDMKDETTEETNAIYVKNHKGSVKIYDNKFENWHGGITLATNEPKECDGSEIYNNIFRFGKGSQLEIEEYCSNSVWHHNKIYDSEMGVSFAPADASSSENPCEFHHNEIILKGMLLHNSSVSYNSYAIKSEFRRDKSVNNWIIHHNTFYAKGKALYAINDQTWKNSIFRDNIFYAEEEYVLLRTGLATEGMYFNYNLYFLESGGIKLFQRWNSNSIESGYSTLSNALNSKDWDGTWDTKSIQSDPIFSNVNNNDMRPIDGSPACSMSSTNNYVGALECIQEEAVCGDGKCNLEEDCNSCSYDCGECPTFCGDNYCDSNENCNSCSQDCGSCPAFCGDNNCDSNENCNSCSQDCGICPTFCGDNNCDLNEDCNSCSQDCGTCPTFCGNDNCDSDESCNSCERDCGTCPTFCGDNNCDSNENCESCSQDCGICPLTENHWLETEKADEMISPMISQTDSTTSNNQYISVPNDSGNDGSATYTVEITEESLYVLWGRVLASNYDDDSFFVQIDNLEQNLWDIKNTENWNWQLVTNRIDDNPVKTFLTLGTHQIKLIQREDGTKIEKILLTNDLNFIPEGFGEQAENLNYCGDYTCNDNESCESCSQDCGKCPSFCGDNVCDQNEDCNSCNSDCGLCPSFCGDYVCNSDETCNNCNRDCGICPSFCGDNNCDSNEDCNSCNLDCGLCSSFCGDSNCDSNEDCNSCSLDCDICPSIENHWLETEFPNQIFLPMKIETDSTASNEKFISVPNYHGYNGKSTYKITINEPSEYILWGRVIGKNNWDDSFFIEIDNTGLNLWDLSQSENWNWQMVSNRNKNDPVKFYLSKGTHIITISEREDGTKIDKLLLTNNFNFIPEGVGEQAENLDYCGDGFCNSVETCSNCAADCNRCQNVCGDGFCDSAESCSSCSQDCGKCEVKKPKSSGGGGGSSRTITPVIEEIVEEKPIENITKEIIEEIPKEIIEIKKNKTQINQIVENKTTSTNNNLTTLNIPHDKENKKLGNKITGFAVSNPVKFSFISLFSLIILFAIIGSVLVFTFNEIDFAQILKDTAIVTHTKISQVCISFKDNFVLNYNKSLTTNNINSQNLIQKEDPYFELKKWIYLARNNGFNDIYIKRILTAQGWRNEIIDRFLINKIQ